MVTIQNLTKSYDGHKAVDDLSITVEDGQIYGFLGPNGAGKSTTMNIMTGCLAATSGTVTINGYDILRQPREAKKLIGYLPEQPPLYLDMTVREYLGFVCGLKGIKRGEVKSEISRVSEMTGIEDHLDRLIRHLSKGYRQRVGIAQAILGSPELVILDEPTVGLDPKQITEIRDLIRQLKGRHTVILSSHILSEISSVCDKIMIIRKGRLVACDTPEGLSKATLGDTTLTLIVETAADPQMLAQKIAGLEEVSRCIGEEAPDDAGCVSLSVTYPSDSDPRREISALIAEEKGLIIDMQENRLSLEDIFLELTDAEEAPSSEEEILEEPEDGEKGDLVQ